MSAVDNRDQHTLEKLRTERQAKIDELKEKTNYYTTQQLIQVSVALFYLFCCKYHAYSLAQFLWAEKLCWAYIQLTRYVG